MFNPQRFHELISAIQKAIRWCEVNDARYFAKELIDMGVPHTVFGQLKIIAAEDIGLADPSMVGHITECSDRFDELLKTYAVQRKNVKNVPEICDLIDRAVIAEAISYKSRILPMATFSTLYEIYMKESFRKSKYEYFKQFDNALNDRDERQTLYYAFILDKFFGENNRMLGRIREQGRKQNVDLIDSWVDAYKRYENLLTLSGSILLLCRDLNFTHGEYMSAVGQYLSVPINAAKIPDRAYDMHTRAGKMKGRGLDYFFTVSGTVKNERFKNDWEEVGKNAFLLADKKKLADDKKIIEAIESKQKPMTGVLKF